MPRAGHDSELARSISRPRSLPLPLRYAAAPAATLVAFLAQRIIVPHPTVAPFVPFFAAIAAASWVGGRGPGLVTSVLSMVVADYFFTAPINTFALTVDALLANSLFLVAGSAVALLCGSLRAAMLKGEDRAALLRARQSELEKAGEAVRQSEEKYRALVETTQTGYTILDAEGKVLDANAEYVRQTGHQRLDEILGHSVIEWTADFDRARNAEEVKRCFETGSVRGLDVTYVDHGGRFTPIEVDATLLQGEGGGRILSLSRDITRRKLAENALRESESRLRDILDNLQDTFLQADLAGRLTAASASAPRMFGYASAEEMSGLSADTLYADPQERRAMLEALRASGRLTDYTVRMRRRDGCTFWVSMNVQFFRDSTGNVIGTRGVLRDISERKRAEETLQESEARLQAILDNAPVAMSIANRDGTIDYFNRKATTTFGYLPADVPTVEDWFVRAYPDEGYRREVIETWTALTKQALTEHREIESREYRVTCKDGGVKTLIISGVFVAEKLFLTFEDITDRQRAAETIRWSESVLSQAGEMASLGAWWIDYSNLDNLNDNALHWSPEVFRIFGYQPDEVAVSIPLFVQRVHPGDRARVEAAVAHALATRTRYSLEHRIVRPDGTERVVWEHGEGVYDDAGRPRHLVGAVQDITERRRAEEALREADRRKGEFLGMLSHELRNPLTPIRNSLYILDRATPGGAQARRAHEVIDRQVSHLTRLVDDLLDVTRISRGKIRLQRTRIDLREVIRGTLEDHRTVLEGREVAVEVPKEAVWIDGDPTRLAQVVGNLLTNAAKFTPEVGSISVSLATEGGQAVLDVSDTGMGIDPETLKRLFEPFAQADRSLDRSRGGLGLGLALVKGMVELHGGEVSAHSEGPAKGARFTIKLPLAEQGKAPKHLSVVPPPVAAKDRRVLVIEDNADAADTLCEALVLAGHKVVVAYDGNSGVAKARTFHPEVVLCDIGLPGEMDGYAVARVLRQDPSTSSIRLVALTGYAQPEDRQRARAAGFDAHLAKPPNLPALERLLAEGIPGFEVQHETTAPSA